jgi:hypothetical protein
MFLFFIFYVFSPTKSEDRTSSVRWGGDWHWWEGRVGREGGRRMNMVHIMCTHVCKCKNDSC